MKAPLARRAPAWNSSTYWSTLAESERDPVVQRRIVQPEPAGDARHDQLAAVRHVVDDADADGVVRLPQIVAGEPGQDERQRDERKRRGRQRQPKRRKGPSRGSIVPGRPTSSRFLGVAALELLDPAGGVDDLLLAGVERVRLGRHLDLHHRIFLAVRPLHGLAALGVDGRAGQKGVVRAGVEKDHRPVFGVDAWFHRARIIKEKSGQTPFPLLPEPAGNGVRPVS